MTYTKGNKYVPHSKSIGGPLSNSQWSRKEHKQEFLYHIRQFNPGKHVFSLDIDAKQGDIYLDSDLTPYVEPELPEKWFIDRILSEEIVHWFNEQFPLIKYSTYERDRCYLCLPAIDRSLFPHSSSDKGLLLISGYEQITLEQFKNYVKQKEMEIIGYKCPVDLFGGNPEVVKGTIFVKHSPQYTWYAPEKEKEKPAPNYLIPQEIVEKWDPVYREYSIGDYIYDTVRTSTAWPL